MKQELPEWIVMLKQFYYLIGPYIHSYSFYAGILAFIAGLVKTIDYMITVGRNLLGFLKEVKDYKKQMKK